MQGHFDALARYATASLHASEEVTSWWNGEQTDFVRLNRGRVRQPGSVTQLELTLRLLQGQRHASSTFTLCGQRESDEARVHHELRCLRVVLGATPEDPFLVIDRTPVESTTRYPTALPSGHEVISDVLDEVRAHDFVGIYAGGVLCRGFASSLGHRLWFERPVSHLDFSLYHRADRAVKASCAGFTWDKAVFAKRFVQARADLEALSRPAKTIAPGLYPVYLSPAAVHEVLQLLCQSGFGLKAQRTRQSPLLKMLEESATLHSQVRIREHTQEGAGPSFQSDGFTKPPQVELISAGMLTGCLASPRWAREYAVPHNGAEAHEMPVALDMAAGSLPSERALKELGRGIYVSNLWYLNFSDHSGCRITGMTRFACLWVEGGEVVAPLSVMRFDDTLYRMWGTELVKLSEEREMILDADTYGRRSTRCAWVPGALVDELTLTL